MPEISRTLSLYLQELQVQMRHHQRMADEASAKWERVSARVNAVMDQRGDTDPLKRSRAREVNLELNGAFDKWGFHQREVLRFSAMITGEVAIISIAGDLDL